MIASQIKILKISESPPITFPTINVRIVPNIMMITEAGDSYETLSKKKVYKAIHHPEVTSKKPNLVSSFETKYIEENEYSKNVTNELSIFLNYASRSQNFKKIYVMFIDDLKQAHSRIFGHLLTKRAMSSMLSLTLAIDCAYHFDSGTINCLMFGLSRLRELQSMDIHIVSQYRRSQQEQLEFAKILKNFQKLRILKIKLDNFDSDASIMLAKSLSKLDELKSLNLHLYIGYRQYETDLNQIINSLHGKKSLESLEFIFDNLKINEVFHEVFNISSTLPNLKKFKYLDESYQISNKDLLLLLEKFITLQNLELQIVRIIVLIHLQILSNNSLS